MVRPPAAGAWRSVTAAAEDPTHARVAASRSANHLNLVVVNDTILFFNIRDGPYFPTLHVLHKCAQPGTNTLRCAASLMCFALRADPEMMPRLRVDKGAIRFVFAGANIMCPGLTSAGATLHDEVDEDTPVVSACLLDVVLVCADARSLLRRPFTRRGRRTRWRWG